MTVKSRASGRASRIDAAALSSLSSKRNVEGRSPERARPPATGENRIPRATLRQPDRVRRTEDAKRSKSGHGGRHGIRPESARPASWKRQWAKPEARDS